MHPEPLTVRFTAVGGTAREGIDYELPESAVVLEPYVPWGLIFLNLISDGVEEPTRDLLIDASIDGSTNAPIRIEVRILDGDSKGKVGFISTRFSVNEAAPQGYAEVSFWRTQDGESYAFDQYEESFGMRMYRSVPPEPLEGRIPTPPPKLVGRDSVEPI